MPSSIIPESRPGRKPGTAGLYIFPYVLRYLKAGTITPRMALLLAHVDRAVNSWASRNPEKVAEDSQWTPYLDFKTAYLRTILCCDEKTVRATVLGLDRHRARRHLFRATRLDRRRWRLQTVELAKPDDATVGDRLYIPWQVRKVFEGGKVTPMELLVLALVGSLTLRGALCYISNQRIGEFLGIGRQRAKRIVRALVAKKLLTSEYVTKNELRKTEWITFRGTGGRTVRLLTVVLPPERDGQDEEQDDWSDGGHERRMPRPAATNEWDDDQDEW